MTREEAIKVLNMVEAHGLAAEAKRIAIKALEQEPVFYPQVDGITPTVVRQEPREDAISRQAVMRVLDEIGSDFDSPRNAVVSLDEIADAIQDLPSVNPQEPKTGHWIDTDEGFSPCECSECESVEFRKSKYCPNCGARMGGDTE